MEKTLGKKRKYMLPGRGRPGSMLSIRDMISFWSGLLRRAERLSKGQSRSRPTRRKQSIVRRRRGPRRATVRVPAALRAVGRSFKRIVTLPFLRRTLIVAVLSIVMIHIVLLESIGAICFIYRFENPRVTGLMAYRRLVTGYENKPVEFVPLEKLPAYVPAMFVGVEDYTFYEHHGIDIQAIKDAYRINKKLGYIYYGGSTITQQLARTLFLTPTRTYVRKYLEALLSMEMELILTKDRILELYINYIEYGQGIYGIGAAAHHAYGKPATSLGKDQYRRLVTIIVSPLRYTVNNFRGRAALTDRYDYLLSAFP